MADQCIDKQMLSKYKERVEQKKKKKKSGNKNPAELDVQIGGRGQKEDLSCRRLNRMLEVHRGGPNDVMNWDSNPGAIGNVDIPISNRWKMERLGDTARSKNCDLHRAEGLSNLSELSVRRMSVMKLPQIEKNQVIS